MTVALFVPCYIDQFYPQVAIATLQVLEKAGNVVILQSKPVVDSHNNSGFEHLTDPSLFEKFETD